MAIRDVAIDVHRVLAKVEPERLPDALAILVFEVAKNFVGHREAFRAMVTSLGLDPDNLPEPEQN